MANARNCALTLSFIASLCKNSLRKQPPHIGRDDVSLGEEEEEEEEEGTGGSESARYEAVFASWQKHSRKDANVPEENEETSQT